MFNLTIRIFFIYLVLNLTPSSYCLRSRGYGSKFDKESSVKQAAPISTGNTSSTGSPTPRRGLGISAWGLITLIVSIILAMAGMYYFSICYPVFCKKPRKYDMIGLPTVV